MCLTTLTAFVHGGLLSWLGLIVALVLRGLLTGAINTDGLLRPQPGEAVAMERVALLLATLGYASFYVTTAVAAPQSLARLPDVPDAALTALFGVNGLYLTGKVVGMKKQGG